MEQQQESVWQLPAPYVDRLANIGTVRSYRRNAIVIQEGDQGDTMFVVLSGRVRVYLSEEDGKEVLLNEHGPGEHFGEMMLDYGPRSASVMTIEPCRFAVISREEVERFLIDHPDVAAALIRMLIGRVRTLTRTVGSLALLDVYGRVARLLLDRATQDNGRLVVEPPITHQDIAKRVGASREMVTRIIRDLRAGGYIETEEHRMFIVRQPPKSW
ncbi:MAG: cyclic nucleotide-binding domain-containing protein [Betaproteobacteria bacterium]|nr:cyclic nucleotide-binding domain-containing protein [Betaproteobacteria bacterium]